MDPEKMDLLRLRSMTRRELEAWAQSLGEPPYRGRQLFQWLWRPGVTAVEEMTSLPRRLRELLAPLPDLEAVEPMELQRSRDGTIKLAWRLPDGAVVESVVIPERSHNTLCLSTQVGCRMGCRFCLTARMGFVRHLAAGEIALQVLRTVELLRERRALRNLVFMGMGEPLDNLENTVKAVEILTDPLGLDFSHRRITVSTSGLAPEMARLGERVDVGLAVSLHATTDELRSRLMPVNRRYPLPTLMEALRRYPLPRRRRITVEYLMLRGVNDSPGDAERLARLLRGLPVKVNLIPFNPSPGMEFLPSTPQAILAFQTRLKGRGLTAVIRKSRGRDISAACGQLYRYLARSPASPSLDEGALSRG